MRSNLAQVEGYGFEYILLANRDEYDAAKLHKIDLAYDRRWGIDTVDGMQQQMLILNLEGGIMNCPQPLVPNTDVKFAFERVPATYALFYDKLDGSKPTALDQGKPITIKDCYLELEYVSSPYLRNLHSQIIEKPIKYHYDDCQIYMKDLAKGSQTLRVNSLCGGLTPEYIFAGFMPAKCLDPDFISTSIRFENPGIRDACITLNGAPVQGYPISMIFPDTSAQIYSRFLDTIGKWKKSAAAGTIPMTTFGDYFCLLSHQFEGEHSNEGWIGFDIKLSKATEKDYTFGKQCKQILSRDYCFSCFRCEKQCDCHRPFSQDNKSLILISRQKYTKGAS